MATSDPLASLEGDMLDVAPGVELTNGDIKATDHVERLPNVAETCTPEPKANGNGHQVQECDVLVVGAGFSGVTAIHRFRKLGLSVKCFEKGEDFGGTWFWNSYPGARVDSEVPFYQLNIPEVYNTWNFSQRFPGHKELKQYFAHADKVLDLRKDVTFSAQVIDCSWDEPTGRWTVKTADGHIANSKYLFLGTGALHRKYTPDFPGIHDFKGQLVHSAFYPQDLNCTGKKIAVIGAGSTGVQIQQELGKVASQMTAFIRRPSYCLPMGQRVMTEDEQLSWQSYYPTLFESARKSLFGLPAAGVDKSATDATEEERLKLWDMLWSRGAFSLLLLGYNDLLFNPVSNRLVYDYWASKSRQKLTDPKKQAIMVPEVPPYHFGTKRTPLENGYYDVLNQDHVSIVDLNANPIKAFEETGVRTSDGELREFDVVIFATGFDSFTGSLTNMGLKSKDGKDLQELWKDGIFTYLGLTISGFPNCFM
jgi:cation diffusion facilitator CzcD-associated flavoprotein CzcO